MPRLDPKRYKEFFSNKYAHNHSCGLYWDTTENKFAFEVDGAVASRFSSLGTFAQLAFTGEAQGDVLRRGSSGWEIHPAGTDGNLLIGDGTDLNSVAMSGDASIDNTGALALGNDLIKVVTGSISAADIVATGAGKLGHANGYPLLAAVGTHNVPEFISCVLIADFDTAAYTDGGNVTVNLSGGGAAQSDPVAAADFIGAAADKVVVLRPPTAAAGVAMVENAGLNLVAATAFTNPGTAAGVIRYALNYRVHATGL
jgi:hypothetical protein